MKVVIPSADSSLLLALNSAINNQPGQYDPQAFASLRLFQDTDHPLPLLSVDRLYEIYELYYVMEKFGVNNTYVWLKDDVIPKMQETYERYQGSSKDVISKLPSLIVFDSPLLAEQRDREIAVLAVQAGEGIITDTRQCAKCDVNVRMKIVQDRSADEGPSTHFTCPKCGCSWKEG